MDENIKLEKILEKFSEVTKASPSKQLIQRIEDTLLVSRLESKDISMKYIYGMAASLLLLVSINLSVIFNDADTTPNLQSSELDTEYDLIPQNAVFYE